MRSRTPRSGREAGGVRDGRSWSGSHQNLLLETMDVRTLVLLAVFTAIASSGGGPSAHGATVAPRSHADRVAAARGGAELGALEALLEAERGRPSGARVRDVIDGRGHRLVLFVARVGGAIERVHSFEPGFTFMTLYVLLLDARGRPRLLLVQPQGKEEAYGGSTKFLFGRDGRTAARNHTYGTSTDCADGRIHERRVRDHLRTRAACPRATGWSSSTIRLGRSSRKAARSSRRSRCSPTRGPSCVRTASRTPRARRGCARAVEARSGGRRVLHRRPLLAVATCAGSMPSFSKRFLRSWRRRALRCRTATGARQGGGGGQAPALRRHRSRAGFIPHHSSHPHPTRVRSRSAVGLRQ